MSDLRMRMSKKHLVDALGRADQQKSELVRQRNGLQTTLDNVRDENERLRKRIEQTEKELARIDKLITLLALGSAPSASWWARPVERRPF